MSRIARSLSVVCLASAAVTVAFAQSGPKQESADVGAKLFSEFCFLSPSEVKPADWARGHGFVSVQQQGDASAAAELRWRGEVLSTGVELVLREPKQCIVELRSASVQRAIENLKALVSDGSNPAIAVSLFQDRRAVYGAVEYHEVAYLLKFTGQPIGMLWQVSGTESEAAVVQVFYRSGFVRVEP